MKVLWAFDPFQKNQKLNIIGKKILDTFFDSSKNSISAVYVASKAEAELTTAFNIPDSIRYSLYPKKVINAQLKKLKMRGLAIDIIPSIKMSLSSMIKEFVKYTKEQKIDLVIMSSNGKDLLPRLILGSFCETLIHSSECDLLIYHQKTKFDPKVTKKILYAHDFTEKGNLGLKRIIEYATDWDVIITIVHIPMFLSDMTYVKFKTITEKRALEIEKIIKKDGRPYEMIINYEVKPVHKIILSMANKMNADLIAVSAQSSKFTALLGGSTTRQILRESKIPSLILKVK